MYWWHINRVPETSLIQRCYKAQKLKPARNDWIIQLEKDKKEFGISFNDEKIKTMSKGKFMKIVKGKAKLQTMIYLDKLKAKHSKSENLETEMMETQKYLIDNRIRPHEAKLLFNFRTRMFDCKKNYKNKYGENQFLFCELCLVKEDCQSHIFDCFVLKNSVEELRNSPNVKYEHIFEDVEKQIPAIKLMDKIVSIREILRQKLPATK